MTRAERRAIREKRLRMEFKRRLPWHLRSLGHRKFGGGVWTEQDCVRTAEANARIAVKTPKRVSCMCCSHQRELYGPSRADVRRLWLDVDPEVMA